MLREKIVMPRSALALSLQALRGVAACSAVSCLIVKQPDATFAAAFCSSQRHLGTFVLQFCISLHKFQAHLFLSETDEWVLDSYPKR